MQHIKLLNDEQIKQAKWWLKDYKFVWICDKCGSVYGTDFKKPVKICPTCLNNFKKKKKEKKERKSFKERYKESKK